MQACDAGGMLTFAEKSRHVAEAGGAGAVLLNGKWDVEPGSLSPALPYVPTVHLHYAASERVRAYLKSAQARATAALSPSVVARNVSAPAVADFSSRGPLMLTSSDAGQHLLKPDILSPGQTVIAGAPAADRLGQAACVMRLLTVVPVAALCAGCSNVSCLFRPPV